MTTIALEWLDDQQLEALPCRQVEPDAFFAELPSEVEWAKSLCQSCPVRAACLAAAHERREPWGVWGGELFINGVVVPHKRPRGRPRKNPIVDAPLVATKDDQPGERAA